ncbi:GNAT family N-acetyltransferase [Paenibacillus harenae]|uniref:Aminoglycoside 6'-N-acetyltransferase n=1 Tax=Paenibacillus harenae TaxID=306543 RepID=A0ABT9U213_PAEHA|nr:GNAT family N-acetyltransferase [Paenibacillus harenae]MDQ0112359.1 aminoglycoside 6'-N-acetyltransferase [Paenibacillus harenae]
MILFQNQELGIRTLEPADAVLLEKWLTNPVVLEYYEGRDRPHDQALVHRHFYDEMDATTRCVILYDSIAIGYIQFYEIDEDEKEEYGYGDSNGKIFGMDQFIGEPAYWNRGIGSRLIKDTVQYLIHHHGATIIVMDPQAWNARAIRVYEKSGFVKIKLLPKHELHEGEYRDCWLIEYNVNGREYNN